eukprot:371082-Pelagomonas_calceolata.AAC.1
MKARTLLQSQQHGISTCQTTFEYNQQLCRKKEGMVGTTRPQRHSRDKVLNGAESGWVPQPDCLETPSTT